MTHIKVHRPKLYRYAVAEPGVRISLNRYPHTWIGVAIVVGRYAYCVKWGRAR